MGEVGVLLDFVPVPLDPLWTLSEVIEPLDDYLALRFETIETRSVLVPRALGTVAIEPFVLLLQLDQDFL